MNHLWIQYSHEDTEEASVCQTAASEQEARGDDDMFPGCPWYRYDAMEPTDGKPGDLSNETGPFYFAPIFNS